MYSTYKVHASYRYEYKRQTASNAIGTWGYKQCYIKSASSIYDDSTVQYRIGSINRSILPVRNNSVPLWCLLWFQLSLHSFSMTLTLRYNGV